MEQTLHRRFQCVGQVQPQRASLERLLHYYTPMLISGEIYRSQFVQKICEGSWTKVHLTALLFSGHSVFGTLKEDRGGVIFIRLGRTLTFA